MQETIIQIVEQHHKIVKHFLMLQKDMENISEMIAILGYDIEQISQSLQEKSKDNTLREVDDVK